MSEKIGLALSGGGIRAAIFHIGTLKFLAKNKMLSNVSFVSSVSGGSILIGLILHLNKNKWPNDQEFLNMLPKLEKYFNERAITNPRLLIKFFIKYIFLKQRCLNRFFKILIYIPTIVFNIVSLAYMLCIDRRKLLSLLIASSWSIKSKFSEINFDESFTWDVCATTIETGNMWRIKKDQMGDHEIGYISQNDLSLSDVMSISASFPYLIGPLKIKTSYYKWKSRYTNKDIHPKLKNIHIYDGGIYDNMALEGLFDLAKCKIKERTGVEFIIVSDASAPLKRKRGVLITWRLLDVFMANVNKLRKRCLMDLVLINKRGIYLEFGSSIDERLQKAKKSNDLAVPESLIISDRDEKRFSSIYNYGTNLFSISRSNYEKIVDYGYKMCETMYKIVKNS